VSFYLSVFYEKGGFMTDQEKLDTLISDFKKLEESRKDYIRELTRKLVDIHCGKGFRGAVFQEDRTVYSNANWIKEWMY
jgi:hypothetical protein